MDESSEQAERSHSFQVAIDCREPHVLADWWAETLGWQVEEQDEGFIRSMIEQGQAHDADTTTHRDRLVERGATELYSGQQGPHTWVTMADPEDNEFCV